MNLTLKLELLKRYMTYFIDKANKEETLSFYDWAKQRRPQFVKGTPEHTKFLATNCYYCGKEFTSETQKTIDHFFPVSKGGRNNSKDNALVICCYGCNQLKNDMHPRVLLKHLAKSVIGKNQNPLFGAKSKKVLDSVSKISSAFEYGQQNKLYYKQQFRIKKAPYIFELREK